MIADCCSAGQSNTEPQSVLVQSEIYPRSLYGVRFRIEPAMHILHSCISVFSQEHTLKNIYIYNGALTDLEEV